MAPLKVKSHRLNRISQGDVFRDVEYIDSAIEDDGIIIIDKIVYPLIVV